MCKNTTIESLIKKRYEAVTQFPMGQNSVSGIPPRFIQLISRLIQVLLQHAVFR